MLVALQMETLEWVDLLPVHGAGESTVTCTYTEPSCCHCVPLQLERTPTDSMPTWVLIPLCVYRHAHTLFPTQIYI